MQMQEEIAFLQGYDYIVSQSTNQVVTDARIRHGFEHVGMIPFDNLHIPFSNRKLDLELMQAEFIDVSNSGLSILLKDLN